MRVPEETWLGVPCLQREVFPSSLSLSRSLITLSISPSFLSLSPSFYSPHSLPSFCFPFFIPPCFLLPSLLPFFSLPTSYSPFLLNSLLLSPSFYLPLFLSHFTPLPLFLLSLPSDIFYKGTEWSRFVFASADMHAWVCLSQFTRIMIFIP